MDNYQEKYTSNFRVDEPEKIREKTQRLIRGLVEILAEVDLAEMNHLLQETKPMSYSIQGYLERLQLEKSERDMLMHAGYNSALLDIMRLYTAKMDAQDEIQKVTTKYRDMILRILDQRGTLLHKDLAAELMTTSNNLTAVIKQMNATSVKLIHVEEFSKFKAYSLTPIARQYIKKGKPKTSVNRKTQQKPVSFEVGQKNIDVQPDSRFDEMDIQNEIISFTGDKYSRKVFMASIEGHVPQQKSSCKFSYGSDRYDARKAQIC